MAAALAPTRPGADGTTHDAAIDEPAVDCAKPAAAAQFPGHCGRPLQGPGVQYEREDVESGMGDVERAPSGRLRLLEPGRAQSFDDARSLAQLPQDNDCGDGGRVGRGAR